MVMGGPAVAILVPMLGRPHRVEPLLDSVATATKTGTYRVLFLVTPGDTAVIEAADRAANGHDDIEWMRVDHEGPGNYAAKINAGYRATWEPTVFLGADDLAFHAGWYDAAASRLDDPRVGVVGTNDLCNKRVERGEHATHFLVRRSYIDKYGTVDERHKVLHEGYPHEYVDDELVGTARKRDAWAFAADSIVEHLHPMVGKAPMDELYAAQPERMRIGRKIYRDRRHLWT